VSVHSGGKAIRGKKAIKFEGALGGTVMISKILGRKGHLDGSQFHENHTKKKNKRKVETIEQQ